jgi:hypothetical protein
MLATAALGLTILWFSRGRFRWWHSAIAAEAMRQEFIRRWGTVFGLTGGGFGFKRMRIIVLTAYAAGFLAAIIQWKKRYRSGFGLLAGIAMMQLFLLCMADSTKSAAYLVHIVPWLAALLAVLLVEYWRPVGMTVLTLVAAIQILGTGYVTAKLQYQREYLPAVRFTDDHRLGYYLHNRPQLVAMDDSYQGFAEEFKIPHPEIYGFINDKLKRSKLVFSNSLYKIYFDPDPR